MKDGVSVSKRVCETWCVTKLCVKDGVRETSPPGWKWAE